MLYEVITGLAWQQGQFPDADQIFAEHRLAGLVVDELAVADRREAGIRFELIDPDQEGQGFSLVGAVEYLAGIEANTDRAVPIVGCALFQAGGFKRDVDGGTDDLDRSTCDAACEQRCARNKPHEASYNFV